MRKTKCGCGGRGQVHAATCKRWRSVRHLAVVPGNLPTPVLPLTKQVFLYVVLRLSDILEFSRLNSEQQEVQDLEVQAHAVVLRGLISLLSRLNDGVPKSRVNVAYELLGKTVFFSDSGSPERALKYVTVLRDECKKWVAEGC